MSIAALSTPQQQSLPVVVPFYKKIPDSALKPIAGLSRSAQLTLLQLHRLIVSRTGAIHYGIPRIASELGISRPHLQRDLTELFRHGCDCKRHRERPRTHHGLVFRDGRSLRIEGAPVMPQPLPRPVSRRVLRPQKPRRITSRGEAALPQGVRQFAPPHRERSLSERSFDLLGGPTRSARRPSRPERALLGTLQGSSRPKGHRPEAARGPQEAPRALSPAPEKDRKRIAEIIEISRERQLAARIGRPPSELTSEQTETREELRKAELERQARELLLQDLLSVLTGYLGAHQAGADWKEVLR